MYNVSVRSNNHNDAITPHFDISILLECRGPLLPASDRDGTVFERTGTIPLPTWRPVVVAQATADQLKDVRLLKRFDPKGRLLLDFELADALEQGDRRRADSIVSGYARFGEIEVTPQLRIPTIRPEDLLAQHISESLEGTRFVIWRDERVGKLRPGLLCENAVQAAYALLVERLGRPGNWSRCKRCRKFFQKRLAAQPYCSPRCRTNDAMKRYRRRKAKRRQRKQSTKSQQVKRRTRQ